VPELVGTFEDAAKKWTHQWNHWTMQVLEYTAAVQVTWLKALNFH
jgi:hypothetical protein